MPGRNDRDAHLWRLTHIGSDAAGMARQGHACPSYGRGGGIDGFGRKAIDNFNRLPQDATPTALDRMKSGIELNPEARRLMREMGMD